MRTPPALHLLWIGALVLVCETLGDAPPSDYALLRRARVEPLRPPSTGPEVSSLQNALAGATFAVPLTGAFDAATTAALEAFQSSRNLTADGAVGPATMAAFDAALGLTAGASAGLLRITDAQVTPAIAAGAVAVLDAHWRDDVGSEVPFTADGAPWVGRVELHWHPFAGPAKPWGYHHGVSVYCVVGSSCVPSWTGSAFVAATEALPVAAREAEIRAAVLAGRVPSFASARVPVTSCRGGHCVVFEVAPDYLALGTDADFLRIPTASFTAQEAADAFGAVLPTTMMVDLIWAAAAAQLEPRPLPPGPNMTRSDVFAQENAIIEAQLRALPGGAPPRTALIAGDKKDIVASNGYIAHPNSTCIYGWHIPETGAPIQPLFCGHASTWADYSHGVRLVSSAVLLDGSPTTLAAVLADPVLWALLSDEGPIPNSRIPIPSPPLPDSSEEPV